MPPPPSDGSPPPPGSGPPDPERQLQEAPRRLHPFSIIRGFQLRSLLGAIPAVLVLGSDPDVPSSVLVVGLVALGVFIAVARVLAWQRHTYEFAVGRVVERSGIISRKERALEVDRIQQVDVERTLLDRLVGTCELRLETAADTGESELRLRVVSVEEARRLRGLLARRIGAGRVAGGDDPVAGTTAGARADGEFGVLVPEDAPEDRAREEVLVEVPLRHVVLAAVTGPRLLVGPAAIAALFGAIAEFAAPDEIVDTAGDAVMGLSVLGGLLLFVGLVILSVLVATANGVLRDGGFTIGLRGDDLLVRRGLTTTRSATVPMRRVQRVTVRRRWLQDRLGYASVTVHSAGGGRSSGGTDLDRSLSVPLLPAGAVAVLVDRLLGVEGTPALHRHPPSARRRSVVRGMLGPLGLLVPLVIFAFVTGRTPLAWLALPVLLLGAAGGWLAYDKLASGADDEVVAGRTGLFGTTTELSPLRKTQGTAVTSSYFQRRLGLATLAVRVAGPAGGIELLDLDEETARRLAPTLYT